MEEARCGTCGAAVRATAKFCSECGAPLTREGPRAEYKQVTVLFADVVRSMDIARSVGAERLREIMAQLVDCAGAVVRRYGGTVDKFTGDGIMAVFGAPISLEDHAVRACLSALGVQDGIRDVAEDVRRRDGVELQLRIGLNSGQVITGELATAAPGYTAIGEHVGMAQRMESVAPPGGVMLSGSTVRLVQGVAALGEPESVHLKGSADPIVARRLLGFTQRRGARRSESQLVGRRWEMTALEGLLDRAIEGQGAVVGVTGPAGIGKSRLARELAEMATARGVDLFATFCESHTSQVPFHVVKSLFRAATGVEGLDAASARTLLRAQSADTDSVDLALFEDLLGIGDANAPLPSIDPDARRRRLTAWVNAASLAAGTPAVYLIEDAHWIDEASESLFADFLSVIPQTPLLTVITYRSEYRGTLAQVPGAQTFALAPLSDHETAALVSHLLGDDDSVRTLAEAITERAAGTPFFAEEIALELAERGVLQGEPGSYVMTADAADVVVPATLQATIASRIDRLDPKAKRTLAAAAVVGLRFGTELLTDIGVDPVVDDLLAAQLIDQVTFTRHPEYVFHQPLIRTVAYETQLKSDRAEVHRRVAATIEQRSAGSGDGSAALIAEHLEAARDLDAAYEWHMRAGTWSVDRDIAAARLSWERARLVADAFPVDHPDRTVKRIAPRTTLCATDWRVHAEDSAARFAELRELCAAVDDKTSLAIAAMGPMAAHSQRGEFQEAQRLASEQLALLDSIGDPMLTAQAAFGAMGVKAQTGEMAAVLRWAQATIDWADGDPTKGSLVVSSPLAVALALRGMARWWLGHSTWHDDLDNAAAFAQQSAEPLTLAVVLSWRYGMGIWHGVLLPDDRAVHTVEAALQTAEAAGNDYAVVMVKWLLGSALMLREGTEDRHRGHELLIELREVWLRQRYHVSELPVLETYLGREQALAGHRDEGIATLRNSVEEMMGRGHRGYYIPATGLLVEALLDRGGSDDVTEAQAAIAALAAAPADGSVIPGIWLLHMEALLARARGDHARYGELRDRYREMATSLGFEAHMRWAAAMP